MTTTTKRHAPKGRPAARAEKPAAPRHPHPAVAAALAALGLDEMPADQRELHQLTAAGQRSHKQRLAWTAEQSRAYAFLRSRLPYAAWL